MAGLSTTGFTPLTYDEIKANIESRLEQYNAGFDFSPESPDGQLIGIFGVLLAQAWTELENVYHSYNPNVNTGQALRNIGMITGLYKGSATRSTALIGLVGTTNTLVPKGSIVTDADGNEFYTNKDAYISSGGATNATVLAVESGPIPVGIGALTTIKSVVPGWTSITQTTAGTIGKPPVTETEYRNLRNKTVMKGATSVQETMSGALMAVGAKQVRVVNNDSGVTLADGTPAKSIQVIIGDANGVTDEVLAQTIFKKKGFGVPTYGAIPKVVQDVHGYNHTVNFSKADYYFISVKINVTYHTDDIAGVDEQIKASVAGYINSLLVGEDVIWSRIFGYITPYGEAEVTLLQLSSVALPLQAANIPIDNTHYAKTNLAGIDLTIA